MSFPHDDPAWADTAAFLRQRLAPADRVLAPDPFRWAIPRAERFTRAEGRQPADFAWVVVHKGELERIPRRFLDALPAAATAVFANPVFVVFAAAPSADLPDLTASDHVSAFLANLESLPPAPEPVLELLLPEVPAPAPAPLRAPPRPAPAPPAAPVRRPSPARQSSARQPAPPRPWLAQGAPPAPAREAAFQAELDHLIGDMLGEARGETVLDIGCGEGRLALLLPGAGRITGIDLDPARIATAQARHAGMPRFDFARMDAARLAFPDASFDAVLLIDTLDGLADPAAVLAEAARMLPRSGRLLVSAMNRDSLGLRAQRRLGQDVPAIGFGLAELTGMLRAAGLVTVRSEGCLLSPAWSLPGAAPGLAALEEDPQFLDIARQLGRRAGPDFALAMVLLARKA